MIVTKHHPSAIARPWSGHCLPCQSCSGISPSQHAFKAQASRLNNASRCQAPCLFCSYHREDVPGMTGAARYMNRAPTDSEQTVCLGGWTSISVSVDVHLICCKDLCAMYAVPQVLNVQVLATQVLLGFLRVLKKGLQCFDRAKNGLRLHTAAGYRYFNPRKPRCLLWIAKSNNLAICIVMAASKRFETAST
jgi:hypothetical protein